MNTVTTPPVYSLQPATYSTVTVAPPPPILSPGGVVTTVLLASSIAIGDNMVDVKQGTMSPGSAVLNGLAKETAATLILSLTNRVSTTSVIVAGGVLAAAGFAIDHLMSDSAEKRAPAK